jgi:hypothetical protein
MLHCSFGIICRLDARRPLMFSGPGTGCFFSLIFENFLPLQTHSQQCVAVLVGVLEGLGDDHR